MGLDKQMGADTAEKRADCTNGSEGESEGVARILSVLERNRKHQEILYRTLLYCMDPRRFNDVESFVAEQPEMVYGQIFQTPRTLIGFLVDAGGIDETNARSGLHPREAGMAECEERQLVTTEEGALAAKAFDPRIRLEMLVSAKPSRKNVFLRFLELCTEPQAFSQIERFYADDIRSQRTAFDANALEADYFVSQLERAGGLVWKKAWITTEEGRLFAEHVKKEEEKQSGSTKEDCACHIV